MNSRSQGGAFRLRPVFVTGFTGRKLWGSESFIKISIGDQRADEQGRIRAAQSIEVPTLVIEMVIAKHRLKLSLLQWNHAKSER
jgi:hypothetical protein